MTQIDKALDEVMGHCARLSDRLAADGFIDSATYADLTRVVCHMGRSWIDNDIEAFKIFQGLFFAHYNLVLWRCAMANNINANKVVVTNSCKRKSNYQEIKR